MTDAPPPVVTAMAKLPTAPFGIKVTGSNLQNGMKVYINETQWTNVQYKTTAKVKIMGGKSLKAVVPKGATTHFRFENPDGGETTFDFTLLAQRNRFLQGRPPGRPFYLFG